MARPHCVGVKSGPISAPTEQGAGMTSEFDAARINMVENQVRTNDVTDLPIQDAMRVVRRDRFCPPGKLYLAYAETQIEYAPGWFLLEPRDVSKLLQAIFPQPGERALAIAAPYAAAVLGRMGLNVTAVQPAGPAYEVAKSALDGEAATVVERDIRTAGADGPYDVIVCECAVAKAPESWVEAVGRGGRLAVVERDGPVGKARLYLRGDDGLIARREVFDSGAAYAPGFEPARSFVF